MTRVETTVTVHGRDVTVTVDDHDESGTDPETTITNAHEGALYASLGAPAQQADQPPLPDRIARDATQSAAARNGAGRGR